MLRLLVLIVFLSLTIINNVAFCDIKKDIEEYREPTLDEINAIKTKNKIGLSKADAYSKSSELLKMINSERDNLKNMPALLRSSGVSFDSPFLKNSSEKRWVEQAQQGYQKISMGGELKEMSAPIIFVSQSLGDDALIKYIKEAKLIGAVTVVRGVVGDLFATTKHLRDLAREGGGGISIDPTLFRRFGIQKVPTLLMPLMAVVPCIKENCEIPKHVQAQGHVTLKYFLELVGRQGNTEEQKVADDWLLLINSQSAKRKQ